MSDKPDWLQDQTPSITPGREFFQITTPYRQRLSTLYTVDTVVKKIVEKLKTTGLWSNTYVVFGSDNGIFQGQKRLVTGKYLAYEPSARLPLLIRGPGIPKNKTSGELVSNADFAPTALKLAGLERRDDHDGRPLVRFAEEPDARSDRPLLLEGFGTGSLDQEPTPSDDGASISEVPVSAPAYEAIRTRSWLYVEYAGGTSELYNMKADPYQLSSKHDHSAYAEVRAALSAKLAFLRNCRGHNATVVFSCERVFEEPSPP
jgi:arylsulfatase A-like enzyme